MLVDGEVFATIERDARPSAHVYNFAFNGT